MGHILLPSWWRKSISVGCVPTKERGKHWLHHSQKGIADDHHLRLLWNGLTICLTTPKQLIIVIHFFLEPFLPQCRLTFSLGSGFTTFTPSMPFWFSLSRCFCIFPQFYFFTRSMLSIFLFRGKKEVNHSREPNPCMVKKQDSRTKRCKGISIFIITSILTVSEPILSLIQAVF